jgi:uncharacterized membrane protein SirB2
MLHFAPSEGSLTVKRKSLLYSGKPWIRKFSFLCFFIRFLWERHFWTFGRKRSIIYLFSVQFLKICQEMKPQILFVKFHRHAVRTLLLNSSFMLLMRIRQISPLSRKIVWILRKRFCCVLLCTKYTLCALCCLQLHACFYIHPVPASEFHLNRNDYDNLMCVSAHIIT